MTVRRRTLVSASGALALAVLAPWFAGAEPPSPLVVGTVTDFHGKYGLVVRDLRGRLMDVTLRPGTIIKPRGLRLERGMQVTILGQAAEPGFLAAEIDTAYQIPAARDAFRTNSLSGPDDRRATAGSRDSLDAKGNPPFTPADPREPGARSPR
jgi:hypothetical protein